MRSTPARRPPAAPLVGWMLGLALLLIVTGLKWATFHRFGSAMPDWDQWDAEALKLLVPWFEGDHFAARLFEPHNEHRVVLTKLQNLTLTLANGQWDSRLLGTANALLHGAIAVGFWALIRRWLAPAAQAVLFVFAVLLFGFPLAWQNVLGGFHSQQYWLVGLSFTAIALLPFAATGRTAWWLGLAAAAAALLSMGSGFLASAVILLVLGARLLRGQAPLRSWWPAGLILATLVAVGALTRVEVYYHAQLKAGNLHDFVFSLLRSLEWPLREQDWAGPLLWLPWGLVTWRAWFRPTAGPEADRAAQTLSALGAWVGLQLLATAYARGAGADYPASRYMDTLTFGALVNVAALGWLLWPATPAAWSGTARRAVLLLAGLWLALFGWGVSSLLQRNLQSEMPDARKYYDEAERHMLGYLSTGDPRQLVPPAIPYPSAEGLVERLSHACLRALMPAEIRPSLPLTAAEGSTTFAANLASALDADHAPRAGLSPRTPGLLSRPTWGSYGTDGPRATGEWRSQPLAATVPGWLKFETAGTLQRPGIRLELRDASTDAVLVRIRPSRVAADSWRAAYVPAPPRPFVVVAHDEDPEGWLAFSGPIEMGRLSYAGWQATKHGWLVAELGLGLTALAGLLGWMTRPRRP